MTLPITVSGSSGTPTGQVQVFYGTTSLGTVTLSGGTATLVVAPRTLAPGARALSLRYGGDGTYAPATGTTKVTVLKAVPTIGASIVGGPVRAKTKGPKLSVVVSAAVVTPTGTVTVTIGSWSRRVGLVRGSAVVKPPAFAKAKTYTVKVSYGGSSEVEAAKKNYTLKVRRKK